MKKFSEISEKLKKDKDDPCWKGYVQVGMKKKNGKEVPNCVPKENTDEAMSLADIRRKKEREERRKRDHDGETQHQRMMRKVYGNMMGGLKKEEVEQVDEAPGKYSRRGDKELYQWGDINQALMAVGMRTAQIANVLTKLSTKEVGVKEEQDPLLADENPVTENGQDFVVEAVDYFKVAKTFDDYAKKYGGIDKKDFMKVGAFVRQLGRESDVNKQDKTFMAMKNYISAMDTDPRDGVIQIFQKHGMWKNGRIMREGLEEKAVSKAQQKFFGMVRAKQKGEMDDASPEVAKAAKSMSKKDVKDFAKTKHKGLPDKVDEVNKAHNTMFKAAFRKKEAEREKAEREMRLRAKGWVRNDRGGMSKVKESTELKEAPGKYKRRGDKELYQWGDVNQALMAAGIKPPQILDVLTKLSKKEVGLKESTELTEFSDAQLQQLKKAYADLEKINVTSPTYKKLKAMIARMDKVALEKVARAKIRFVSQIAARELAAKGVKLKAGEYMESVQEGVIDDYNALKAKGKSDSAAIDIMMSMAKYRNMTRDQLSKKVGDARRKGIFKR